ncbi:MAG: LCP family protein [Candidatus Paceibacterota bacterium]
MGQKVTKKIIICLILSTLTFGVTIFSYLSYQNSRIERFSSDSTSINKSSTEMQKNKSLKTILLFTTGSEGISASEVEYTGVGVKRGSMKDGLTDSIMLFKIDPNSKKVVGISIPRDTLIESTGRRINEAYLSTGVNGLVDQVYQLTGIYAEHQISVNFNGFAQIIDILGGVKVEFPEPVYDKNAKLHITKPGCTLLDGKTALAFTRARTYLTLNDEGRYVAGDKSSDWGRIERQQFITKSIINKIKDGNNLYKIPYVINSLTGSIKVDKGLSVSEILQLGKLATEPTLQIKFYTYPGTGKNINGASIIVPNKDHFNSLILEIHSFLGETSLIPVTQQKKAEYVDENGVVRDEIEVNVAKIQSEPTSQHVIHKYSECQ